MEIQSLSVPFGAERATALFMGAQATLGIAPSTLGRRVAAIRLMHVGAKVPSPPWYVAAWRVPPAHFWLSRKITGYGTIAGLIIVVTQSRPALPGKMTAMSSLVTVMTNSFAEAS